MEEENLSVRLVFTPDGDIIAVYPFACNDEEEAEIRAALRWIISRVSIFRSKLSYSVW